MPLLTNVLAYKNSFCDLSGFANEYFIECILEQNNTVAQSFNWTLSGPIKVDFIMFWLRNFRRMISIRIIFVSRDITVNCDINFHEFRNFNVLIFFYI